MNCKEKILGPHIVCHYTTCVQQWDSHFWGTAIFFRKLFQQ